VSGGSTRAVRNPSRTSVIAVVAGVSRIRPRPRSRSCSLRSAASSKMAMICTLRENVEKMNGGAPLTNERMTWFHRSRTAGSAADGNACRGAIDISP
jgi:hypothetical protein